MSYICKDCGVDTTPCTGKRGCRHIGRWEHYMVLDEVWARACMPLIDPADPKGASGYLCIGCLEKRVGRKLHFADFTGAPINDPDHPWNTRRLRSRILRGFALFLSSA
jgi:hypothetical protein